MSPKEKIKYALKLFYKGYGSYKRQIFLLTFLGFFGSLLEGVGINAVIPMFSFITGQAGTDDAISRALKAIFGFLHLNFTVKYLLIFICLLFVLKAVLIVLSNYITVRVSSGYEAENRSYLFRHTLKAGWPFLVNQKLGHLETLLMTNVYNNAMLLGYISTVTITLASLLVYTVIAINISFYITLMALVFSAFFLLVYQPVISKTRKLAYEQESVNRQIAHHVNENIMGMKTVKIMAAEGRVDVILSDLFARLKRLKVKSYLFSSLPGSLSEPFSFVFICAIFAISYKALNFNLAAFAAVIYLIKQIFSYAQQLNKYLMAFNTQLPYLRRVLDYKEDIILNKEEDLGKKEFNFESSLEFKNVSFSYKNGEDSLKNVLGGIDLKINKGEMVGLIGPSGAGKTTIVDLFLRLFDPTSGRILIDGTDIKEIKLDQWRKNIGYVSQDIFLKNDTIANNIKFYDDSITDEKMVEAAKMANIYDFIQAYPEKFDTPIGERGILLSAGQRQRIIIARILARDPDLLILDEATSALDNESENQIQKVIENLKHEITVLVVAHRLSTIINADKILVLDKGKIIEEGRPSALLENNKSYFSKMYNFKK